MNWEQQIIKFIKERRTKRGLSGANLAEKLGGIHQSAISKIETGQREMKLRELFSFAEALDIDLADMFSKLQNGEQLTPPPPREIEVDGVRYVIADG